MIQNNLNLSKALGSVIRDLRKQFDFDVAALALVDQTSGDLQIRIDKHEGDIEIKEFPQALSWELKLLNGNLTLISKRGDMLFLNCLLGEEERVLKAALITPMEIDGIGSGSFLIGSSDKELLGQKKKFASLNLSSLLAQTAKESPSAEPNKRQEERIGVYYRTLFECSGTAVAVVERDRTLSEVNREFERLTGYGKAETEGTMTLEELLHSKDRERIIDYLEKRRKDPQKLPFTCECTLIRQDGEERAIDLKASGIPDTDKIIVSLRDITENRINEAELKEWGERLEVINEISNAVNSSLDLQELFTIICSQIKRILDYDRASLALVDTSGKILEVQAIDDGERTQVGKPQRLDLSTYEKLAPAKKNVILTHTANDPSYQVSEALLGKGFKSCLLIPLLSQNGVIGSLNLGSEKRGAFCQFHLDILGGIAEQLAVAIEKARLYKQIKETKDYLESIMESSVEAIVSTDQKGRISFFSKGAEDISGYKAEEVLGKPIHKFFVDGRPEVLKIRQILRKEKGVHNYEKEILRKDGKTLPVSLSVSLLRDDRNKVVGALGIGEDITERRRAEEERRKRSEELENFVYLISHSLKTPIVSLQGFVSVLLSEYGDELAQQGRHYLDRIHKNAGQMSEMIQDLLKFSKVGRMTKPREEVKASDIIEEAIDELRFMLIEKGIKISVPSDLPYIYCDREGISTVFCNLIDNSIKYMGKTLNPQIEIGCQDKRRFHVFWIKDNGIGIDEKYHDKIFDLFQRLNDIKDVEGTGVGLAIVKRIIENHGGSVRISSEVGKGTTCYFTLPKLNVSV
jgi:two-component system sensor kinase FixL